jgi:Zn-dependent M16 (insulinase) family peptidase
MAPMLDLIEELIGSMAFKDLTRLKQLLGEYQAGLESMIVHNGHRLAISLASRAFSPAGALSETWSGVHQVRTIRNFNKQDDPSALELLAKKLTAISCAVFMPDNLLMAAIGEQDIVQRASNQIETREVLSGFSRDHRRVELSPLDIHADKTIPHEGWSTSTAVAFVAQTLPAVPLGHADAPALAVLGKMLRSLYLHGEIREKGGAYGGFALYNPENGLFSLASYRDPHIHRTLKVFEGVWEFVTSGRFEKDDIKEAVLQVCSEIDKPDPPGPSAQKAFSRMIIGLKDEERGKFKQQLLQVTPQKVMEVADHYFKPETATPAVAVIAGADHLKQANEALSQHMLKINAI